MRQLISKRKYTIAVFIALMLALAALALAFVFGSKSVAPAYAEGNDAGVVGDDNFDISLTLDANGRDNIDDPSFRDNAVDKVAAHDADRLKRRMINVDVIVALYNQKNSTEHSVRDFNIMTEINAIKVDSAAFRVERDSLTTLIVTADSYTEDGRFTVALYGKTSHVRLDVKFRVKVYDTFAHFNAVSNGGMQVQEIRVGKLLDSSGNLPVQATDPNADPDEPVKVETGTDAIMTIDNFTVVTIDLGEYLKGRALYTKGATNKWDSLMAMGNARKPWPISSVTNLYIKSVNYGTGVPLADVTIQNPTETVRVTPSVTFKLSLTSKLVDAIIESAEYGASAANNEYRQMFWGDSHNICFKLAEIDSQNSKEYTLYIPVKFQPAMPQNGSLFNDPDSLKLNVSSEYMCEYNGGNKRYYYYETGENGQSLPKIPADAGYKALIIKPSDIVEYAFPPISETYPDEGYPEMRFIASNYNSDSTNNTKFSVDTLDEEAGSERPSAYKITALKDGSYTIKFDISYFTSHDASSQARYTVTLSITCYGNYTVSLPAISGTKAVQYNVLVDNAFSRLRKDGYQMTGAKTTQPNLLRVEFANNVLTLTPNIQNIDGQVLVPLILTFTNNDSQSVSIYTDPPITIDIKADTFWTLFPDWRGVLIIIASVIGGIILLLFIAWVFIHSISKHKQDENATAAPVSSYIVRLNSTIAATQAAQAQQQLAPAAALAPPPGNQMLLGAGTTSTTSGFASDSYSGMSSTSSSTSGSYDNYGSTSSSPKETEDMNALIAKYISDEELLERIYVEKYEPKGMVRRTFFKSKDLQARELEKEKKRIIERYKTPMPMDEAIMSESEVKRNEGASSPSASRRQDMSDKPLYTLDFDPDSPLYVEPVRDEFVDESIDFDAPYEETHLKEVQHNSDVVQKELDELKARMDKVQLEFDKNMSAADILREKIAKAEADDQRYKKDMEDLEFNLPTAKAKEKERIMRDINITEEKIKRNDENLANMRAELDLLMRGKDALSDIMARLSETYVIKSAEQEGIAADLSQAKADFASYKENDQKARARQEMEVKLDGLSPLLTDVNKSDYAIRDLDSLVESKEKERESVKADIEAAKAQILGATDFDVINGLNARISDDNTHLSEIEKELTKYAKNKSDLNIDFNAQRRKANEFVEKNDIPLEDVIRAEDFVLGNIELEHLRVVREANRNKSEVALAQAQAVYDDVLASAGDVTAVAMQTASDIHELEEELKKLQTELDDINGKLDAASDDDKLMLMVDQNEKADQIDAINEKIKQANVDATKRKMEAQGEHDSKLEAARKELDKATEEFKSDCAKLDALAATNPLDLIMSGSGVISQDRSKAEAVNLKKQLEKSQNEMEHVRLAAKMAQLEAEQAKVNAARATDSAKADAERFAQMAIERAEAARREAEEKAKQEAEAAEQARRDAEEAAAQAKRDAEAEAERIKREAEEAAEAARREAEEAAEQTRREAEAMAEQARREAEAVAEQARRDIEAATEQARRDAEAVAEQARRDAEEAAEQARLAAEEAARRHAEETEAIRAQSEEAARRHAEETEAMRAQSEEERRKVQEQIDQLKQESEAKRLADAERQKAEEERKAAIAKKVAARKERILTIRERMRDIKNDDDAKNLREQLYSMQLTFDEDERQSSELTDFCNKTMDDIQHAGEVATLKAENAKKPQRVVKKVTERVNRIPKHKAGANGIRAGGGRPGARPGARPTGARPSGARPGARPGGPRPGARPGARPGGTRPPNRPR